MTHAAVLVVVDEPTEDAIQDQMHPFDENGEWFRDGSRWDWWTIGGRFSGRLLGKDALPRSAVDLAAFHSQCQRTAEEAWDAYERKKASGAHAVGWLYGIEEAETRDAYLKRVVTGFPRFHAFLRNRHWHENERLGWFATAIKSECEVAAGEPLLEGKCLHTCPQTGARIIVWNEAEDRWFAEFVKRFVEPLPPEKWLVTVDFHV